MESATVGEILALAMFGTTILAVLIGYPAAFTLAGTGLFFATLGYLLGVFDFSLFTGLASRYFGVMVNEVLVAVPLFIFMGVMLERSKIAVQLLETMGQLFGSWRGGLGISVVIVGALLAASTGIVGATVVTMGLLSLPAMLRAGYDPRLSCGIICASGTLGQIIPPSTVLIFMGDMLQGANAAAQAAKGNFVPDPVSVGDLFAGAFLPGLLLVALYIAWVAIRAFFWPAVAPAMVMTPDQRRNLPRQVVRALLPALILIVAVLGSIIGGIASPTESASVGAVGAMLLSVLNRQFSLRILLEVMRSTLKISSMVFLILLGASVFSLVFRGLGGEWIVHDVLSALPGGADGAVLIVMLLTFFLGFFLDTFEIIFIVVPITAPVLLGLDVDPIWLGVMFGINLQTSFLTPPFGFSLFYLRGVAPATVTTGNIYRGVAPFVLLQLIAMLILWEFPGLATWLPAAVYGDAVAYEGTNPYRLDMPEGDLMLPDDEPDLADPDSEAGTLEDMLSGEDPMNPPAE